MTKLKQITFAVVLALAFATSGFAGIMPIEPEPPPPPPSATLTESTDTMPAQAEPATDPVIEFALNVLQSVLVF